MTNGLSSILFLSLLTGSLSSVHAADEADNSGAATGESTRDATQIPPAAGTENLVVQQKLTVQGGYGPDNSTLGEDRKGFYSLRYEPSLTWYSPDRQFPTWQGFARAWLNYASAQTTSPLQEPNEQQPEYFSSEMREFYLKRNLLGGDPRYSLSVGRQKFADHYGIWWDDSIEALRLDFVDTFATGFVAVARKFHNYNTDNNSLRDNDRDITYGMGEYALRWSERNWIGTRLMIEQDSSGDDPDDRSDFRGGRLGLFAYGDNLRVSPLFSDYRLELAALKGRLDLTDSAGATSNEHTHGWALIGNIGKRFDETPWKPRLSLRAGLTDKPSNENEGFYLNNIQSDRVTNKETYTNGLLSSFLSVDLHNLAFYSVAVETQPKPRNSFDVRLSDLYLRDADGGIPINVADDLTATGSKSLGQILDTNYYWQMLPINLHGQQLHLNLLASAGYFWSGNAVKGLDDDFQVSLGVVLRY
ncbi:alginate export family protein [Pseudomonas sp. Irchel s3b5]|uniref:alginate export family protein n=1 Tax=Pseudomonas sp. Irchel s3b5 TaxID=2009077 RepID=UPI000BA49045|nr:alginate export family protein [Pseudomonas sp. Irchel s3b5]